mmetsp:Transcript_12187/g.25753  ORF Transcript_12187/g.25753 Transcript_12187/m.25753 type:complete len:366 (+) Transcript_12187:2050-3147(+)
MMACSSSGLFGLAFRWPRSSNDIPSCLIMGIINIMIFFRQNNIIRLFHLFPNHYSMTIDPGIDRHHRGRRRRRTKHRCAIAGSSFLDARAAIRFGARIAGWVSRGGHSLTCVFAVLRSSSRCSSNAVSSSGRRLANGTDGGGGAMIPSTASTLLATGSRLGRFGRSVGRIQNAVNLDAVTGFSRLVQGRIGRGSHREGIGVVGSVGEFSLKFRFASAPFGAEVSAVVGGDDGDCAKVKKAMMMSVMGSIRVGARVAVGVMRRGRRGSSHGRRIADGKFGNAITSSALRSRLVVAVCVRLAVGALRLGFQILRLRLGCGVVLGKRRRRSSLLFLIVAIITAIFTAEHRHRPGPPILLVISIGPAAR